MPEFNANLWAPWRMEYIRSLDPDLSDVGEEDFSDIEQMLATDEDQEAGATGVAAEEAVAEEETVDARKKPKKEKKAKPEKPKKEKKVKEKKIGAGAGAGKRVVKTVLLALLVLVLVVGLVVGAYFLASSMGVSVPPLNKLPIIGSLLGKGDAAGPRTDVIVVKSTLQNNFATNVNAGKLLIITGSVMNKASAPRRFVKVTATLSSQGNPVPRQESAYCGNMLTFEELSDQTMDYIRQRLANPSGDDNQNTNIKAGATVPFMIVIPDLPPDLVGYEVMVADAQPVK